MFKMIGWLVLVSTLVISGCTTSNLNEGLRPQPQQNTTLGRQGPKPAEGVESTSNSTSETALAESQAPTATEQAINQAGANDGATGPKQKVTFLPVTGAPQSTVTRLSAALKKNANDYGIELIPSTIGGSKYRVKGFFSALDDGSGTLIVYVWDVVDGSGKRVYRISGQQRAPQAVGDPWSTVTPSNIDQVAKDTLVRLETWLRRS